MAYSPAPTSPKGSTSIVNGSHYSKGRSITPPVNPNTTTNPTTTTTTNRENNNNNNSSSAPPLPPPSKRDKRRSALQDRLHDLTASFGQNRDAQFRQQLHVLQCDMTLINNADPYSPGPLPDSPEDVARLIEDTIGGVNVGGGGAGKFAKDMASLAGMWYSRFVQEVNGVKEDRDAELASLMHRHNNNLERFARDNAFRVHFAGEEFDQLSSTLRERLVQTISGKKARLMREKEQLDIADTNALLLHPNQFSITNPASPGGIHGGRKTTRNTRHRVDLDEFNNGILSEINKRKRKAVVDDDVGGGSPVRDNNNNNSHNNKDNGSWGPGPAARAKAHASQQQNAPAYSVNSLFTEKELTAHANQAHVATAHFFASSKRENQQQQHQHPNNHQSTSHSGTATINGNNTDADDASNVGADGTGQEDNNNNNNGTGTPTATDMVRTASQNFHATRSTRTHGNGSLNPLAELSDKPATRPNLPYHILANYHARPNSNAPPLPPLMNEEIDDDCARMERLQSRPAGWVDRNLVEVLVEPFLDEVDGIPQNPERFGLLHPDFPVDMGVHLYPVRRGREKEGVEMFGPSEREKKRQKV